MTDNCLVTTMANLTRHRSRAGLVGLLGTPGIRLTLHTSLATGRIGWASVLSVLFRRLDPRRRFSAEYGMRQRWLCILLWTVFCLANFSAAGQQSTPTTSGRKQPPESPPGRDAQLKPSTPKLKEKLTLADVTRVSTAEATRKAAKDLAKDRGRDSPSEASGVSDVLEFHPAEADLQGVPTTLSKESKKSALKNVHGDAYGALDGRGAGRRAGGSVGATSKSGKTSIDVQTDRSHESTPVPH